jgi:hypothetical protein
LGAGALVLVGLLFAWRSLAGTPLGRLSDPGPGAAPLLLSGLLILAGLWTALISLGGREREVSEESRFDARGLRHAAIVTAAAAFAAGAIGYLGYRLTVFAVLFALIGLAERKPIVPALALSAALAFGTYWLFVSVVRIPLPIGIFGI